MEKVLEELSYQAPELAGETVVIDREYVAKHLAGIITDGIKLYSINIVTGEVEMGFYQRVPV